MRIIKIFDTTLRDGEQSPGASMNVDEKIQVARQLIKLGVDIIEAGFPFASPGDFDAVKRIADEVKGAVIAGLARAKEDDIKSAYEALKDAPMKRIHTFHSTSDIHLKYQFRVSREEALKRSVEMVKLARSLVEDVEFSPMDATRTEIPYLLEVVEAVIEAGASTVNIPDTVGYTTPVEFGNMIKTIKERIGDKAVISVHCHNDLGLAVANSLAAIINGAGQVECTINGIGERAGNCSMEEIVMGLKTRKDFYNADTNINTKEIIRTSRLITRITGMAVQPNKAIVGANAFAHESGIHQDGLLKEKMTYEIMRPEDIGLQKTEFVLGKHSGRHAFKDRLQKLGYELNAEEIDTAFKKFKHLADQKKDIFNEDLETLISEEVSKIPQTYSLVDLSISSGVSVRPTAALKLRVNDDVIEKMEHGDGPVDAVYKAIASITKTKSILQKFEVKSVTGGMDALGEVTVSIEEDGKTVRGHGADTDIIVAAAKAYINALNKLAVRKK
ncbi:MAG TPA: 2-isopropylmalate synthase [Nitrospiraceae bacterium]|nr:MAG: 2-isopropylmalate synthase [Nitrospirae bacterium GWA2_46_11]OGW23756.1 MAG: 2-isopropylmalate synthase [Nitrospirae bacterium GWB2_47_37]HAK89354.1 2-isopropylmalate synthase [Nitrospiraceae bacterium]HCZ10731.1 2-isopropylmalate synthase [Nitrospiraceae bacterium]